MDPNVHAFMYSSTSLALLLPMVARPVALDPSQGLRGMSADRSRCFIQLLHPIAAKLVA